ncbi:MAG: tail fiber domain-containing protein [Candidatus Sulfotelmatobacter sp.]
MKAWKAIGILLFCLTCSWALCQSDTPADEQNSLAPTITGSGKKNYIPLWTSTSNLGNSNIQQAKPSGWSNTAVGLNGAPGSGTLTSTMGVDIEGTVREGSPNGYTASQLVVEGTLASSSYAQAYLRGVHIVPNFDFSEGYGNYAEGAYIGAPNITSGYANVVSSLELGQPAAGPSGTSCSAALNILMPNQSGNCPVGGNSVWSIYNGSPNSSYFAGNVGIGIALPSYPIETGAGAYVTAGGVWTNASSREFKKDIRPLRTDQAMETLTRLDPVTFKYKVDDEAHVGFIAEDVPDLVATGDRKGLSAMDIVAVLTKVVQQQQKELSDQHEEIDALKAQLGMWQRGSR